MPEPKEDVKQAEESSVPEQEQEVVKSEGEQETSAEETTTQETTEQAQEQGQAQKQDFSPVDEKGVPWMNRFYESERKSKELLENLETKMGEILSKQSTQSQPREYTIAELETFAIQQPAYRPWVEEQKALIIQKNVARVAQEEIKQVEEKRTAEQKRQSSFNYVVQSYPECFVKDAFGNLQWNNQSPLVQQIGSIMNDPRFAKDPEGLVAAADMAYGRVSRMQSSANQKKVKALQQNLKKTQKATMIEGSGQQESRVAKDELERAKETLRNKINDKSAAHNAVKAYLKKYGVIEE